MIQCRGGLGFALEAAKSLPIFGYFVGQELERDKTVEANVLGFIDNPHPSATKFLDDAVVRDCLADHGWRRTQGAILGVLGRRSQRGRYFTKRKEKLRQSRLDENEVNASREKTEISRASVIA
jgi:hypothetical protein